MEGENTQRTVRTLRSGDSVTEPARSECMGDRISLTQREVGKTSKGRARLAKHRTHTQAHRPPPSRVTSKPNMIRAIGMGGKTLGIEIEIHSHGEVETVKAAS